MYRGTVSYRNSPGGCHRHSSTSVINDIYFNLMAGSALAGAVPLCAVPSCSLATGCAAAECANGVSVYNVATGTCP